MPDSDLYLDRNTCPLAALALSPSVLSCFILFCENIPHKMSTWLPEKWQTLVLCNGNTSLTLNCLRIQCPDYTKCSTETGTRADRGHDTYTYATENPKLGLFQTGKQTNCKTCLEIFTIIFFLLILVFSYAENVGIQNTPKLFELRLNCNRITIQPQSKQV